MFTELSLGNRNNNNNKPRLFNGMHMRVSIFHVLHEPMHALTLSPNSFVDFNIPATYSSFNLLN